MAVERMYVAITSAEAALGEAMPLPPGAVLPDSALAAIAPAANFSGLRRLLTVLLQLTYHTFRTHFLLIERIPHRPSLRVFMVSKVTMYRVTLSP
jgi:hypothetical protein